MFSVYDTEADALKAFENMIYRRQLRVDSPQKESHARLRHSSAPLRHLPIASGTLCGRITLCD